MERTYKDFIPNFLTSEECQYYIDYAEGVGFEEAMINTRLGQVMAKDVRDNYRVVVDVSEMADDLWEKIKDRIPTHPGWEAIGLNERFRFYRYEDGQSFKRHIDGAFKRNENERSRITFLIFLNDGFEGGQTQFVDPTVIVEAEAGKAVLFQHHQVHAGLPVTSGRKYMLRSDVMYRKINSDGTRSS